MVSFQNAIKLGCKRYSDFKGRSTRSEYWWWALFVVLASIALSLVDVAIGTYNYETQKGLLSGLFGLSTLIPGLALGARRLHDINKSGWWLLMWLICWLIIPLIVLMVWAAKNGDNGPNKYGANPQRDTRSLVPDQILACGKCQSELDNNAKFCSQCGTQTFLQ